MSTLNSTLPLSNGSDLQLITYQMEAFRRARTPCGSLLRFHHHQFSSVARRFCAIYHRMWNTGNQVSHLSRLIT